MFSEFWHWHGTEVSVPVTPLWPAWLLFQLHCNERKDIVVINCPLHSVITWNHTEYVVRDLEAASQHGAQCKVKGALWPFCYHLNQREARPGNVTEGGCHLLSAGADRKGWSDIHLVLDPWLWQRPTHPMAKTPELSWWSSWHFSTLCLSAVLCPLPPWNHFHVLFEQGLCSTRGKRPTAQAPPGWETECWQ